MGFQHVVRQTFYRFPSRKFWCRSDMGKHNYSSLNISLNFLKGNMRVAPSCGITTLHQRNFQQLQVSCLTSPLGDRTRWMRLRTSAREIALNSVSSVSRLSHLELQLYRETYPFTLCSIQFQTQWRKNILLVEFWLYYN